MIRAMFKFKIFKNPDKAKEKTEKNNFFNYYS